jgi:hypothetical protein
MSLSMSPGEASLVEIRCFPAISISLCLGYDKKAGALDTLVSHHCRTNAVTLTALIMCLHSHKLFALLLRSSSLAFR